MSAKKILITGAAKRIGASCSRLLHARGHAIFLHYRDSKTEAERLCNEFNDIRPDSAIIGQADLMNIDALVSLTQDVKSVWGELDVLINNASMFYPASVSESTEHQWDELLGSNLKAPFFLTKELAPVLAGNNGCVINIVDIHAERGLKGFPVYCIAKAGLAAMTKILAKELGPEIRVNGVSPGAIIWPEGELDENEKNEILSRIALNRRGEPEDIAKAIGFLVDEADYITGQVIVVDGGRTLFC